MSLPLLHLILSRARCSISLSVLIRYRNLRTSATVPPPLDNVRRSDIFRLIALPPASPFYRSMEPRKRISRDDVWTYCEVQRGSKAGGRTRVGGLFFSGERKNLICRWLSLEVRSWKKERGLADDDHRSFYSTIVDRSSMDGKGANSSRRSRHCTILNANVKSDLILDKFNNSLPLAYSPRFIV